MKSYHTLGTEKRDVSYLQQLSSFGSQVLVGLPQYWMVATHLSVLQFTLHLDSAPQRYLLRGDELCGPLTCALAFSSKSQAG